MPLPILLAAVLIAHQDIFKKTADHQWAYQAVELMKREGVITGFPSTFYRQDPRGPSRYEMAVVFHAAATNGLNRAEAFLKHPTDEVECASILRSSILLPLYKRAGGEFKIELTALGVEGDFGQSHLAALTHQIEETAPARARLFRDVPADHWAAKAVGDLRTLGLIDGYPDGSYRGK